VNNTLLAGVRLYILPVWILEGHSGARDACAIALRRRACAIAFGGAQYARMIMLGGARTFPSIRARGVRYTIITNDS